MKLQMKKDKDVLKLLLFSGLFGAILGFLHAQYQWVVEPAQILAGIVKYPPENHFYILTMKSWSILNQVSAVLLSAGVSERLLSYIWGSIMGMVSFQALALGLFILSRNIKLSFAYCFFIFFLYSTWTQGINYPITLMGTEGTYATLGLSFNFLVISLFSLKRYKLGGFLLGLAPAVHATQGLWYTLVIFICIMMDFKYHKDFLKKAMPYIMLGYAMSGLSLLYHLLFFYEVPKVRPEVLSKYYYALIKYWTEHLMRFNVFTGNMARTVVALTLGLWSLRFLKERLSRSEIFFIRSFVVSIFIASFFSIVYWLPPEKARFYYNLILMYPARLFNYSILGSFVILVGLLLRFRDNIFLKTNLFLMIAILSIYKFINIESYIIPLSPLTIGVMLSCSLGLIFSFPLLNKNRINTKNYWSMINISAFIIGMFYCFSPFFKGSFFIPFIAILLSMGTVILSMFMLKKENTGNIFLLEGLAFIFMGLMWLFTKSENTVIFERYSLPLIVGLIYMFIAGSLIVIFSLISGSRFNNVGFIKGDFLDFSNNRIFSRVLNIGTVFFLLFCVFFTINTAYNRWQHNIKTHFLDRTNNSLYAELYKRDGLVLEAPGAGGLIMARARRPVLYNGGSSILTYAPEAGPAFRNMWIKAYGVDFLNPPDGLETIKDGLPKESIKVLWEDRSLEEWIKIKEEFGVTDVITPSGWNLKLPQVISNEKILVYTIRGG